jgi:hypothetical protein
VVQRADDDEGANMISFVGVVDEVGADRSATVDDKTSDVVVDEVTTAAGSEHIMSGSQRTPPR